VALARKIIEDVFQISAIEKKLILVQQESGAWKCSCPEVRRRYQLGDLAIIDKEDRRKNWGDKS
jgi:hypothetical protein